MPSFSAAFALALLSTLCWGSWSNSAKAAAHLAFPLFYLDFSLGAFLSALVAFVSPLNSSEVLREEGVPAELSHVLAALGAGALFNVANVLLVLGIQVAGLAVAFPVGIGTALVLGTLLTYAIDPRGRAELLFPGVALAFVAILCQVAAHSHHKAARHQQAELTVGRSADLDLEVEALTPAHDTYAAHFLTRRARRLPRGLLMCCAAGGFMSLWAPLSALSMRSLSAECSFALYTLAVLASSSIICPLLSKRPIVGKPVALFTEMVNTRAAHGWGLLGGCVWATGTLANLVSGAGLGPALSCVRRTFDIYPAYIILPLM
ncbi:MAG: hypothetical protein SGPRY_001999 [Prymnesium sp.]